MIGDAGALQMRDQYRYGALVFHCFVSGIAPRAGRITMTSSRAGWSFETVLPRISAVAQERYRPDSGRQGDAAEGGPGADVRCLHQPSEAQIKLGAKQEFDLNVLPSEGRLLPDWATAQSGSVSVVSNQRSSFS